MKTVFFVFSALLTAACTGCFEHREAPPRLVTATGIEAAGQMRAQVQQVILDGSRLGRLPVLLAEMPRLERLSLRGAEVTDFTVLGRLGTLWALDLAETGLAAIPESLAGLSNLKHLYLTGNALTNLPPALTALTTLEYLNLDRNRLAALPDDLGAMGRLRWLRLNQNQLADLPDAIGKLERLKEDAVKKIRQLKLAMGEME